MKLSLDKLQEIFPDGKMDRRGKNLITNCPQCHEREFSISLEENHLCGCYRLKECGWKGNIVTLMRMIGRVDILINKNINFEKIEQVRLWVQQEELELDLPDVMKPMGWKRVYQHDYLDSRSFTEYERYKVGVTMIDPRLSKGFVVLLVEEYGRVKGWIGRNIRGKKEIEQLNAYYKANNIDKKVLRYINSSSDFAKLLLGLDELTENTKVIIFVEGWFDKMKIDRLLGLHEQEEVKCVVTFKAAVSQEQLFKIQKHAPNLELSILLYDPDVISAIKKTAYELQDYLGSVMVGYAKSGHDPGDFNEDDIVQVFNDLETPTSFSIGKLSSVKLKI